jgi:hypothetical protein
MCGAPPCRPVPASHRRAWLRGVLRRCIRADLSERLPSDICHVHRSPFGTSPACLAGLRLAAEPTFALLLINPGPVVIGPSGQVVNPHTTLADVTLGGKGESGVLAVSPAATQFSKRLGASAHSLYAWKKKFSQPADSDDRDIHSVSQFNTKCCELPDTCYILLRYVHVSC